jgi:hypothetical protein
MEIERFITGLNSLTLHPAKTSPLLSRTTLRTMLEVRFYSVKVLLWHKQKKQQLIQSVQTFEIPFPIEHVPRL